MSAPLAPSALPSAGTPTITPVDVNAPASSSPIVAAFVTVGAALEALIEGLLKVETLRAERDAARRERASVAKVEAGVAARAAGLAVEVRELASLAAETPEKGGGAEVYKPDDE